MLPAVRALSAPATALLLVAGCAETVHGKAEANQSALTSFQAEASSSKAAAVTGYCTGVEAASHKAVTTWQTFKAALDSDQPLNTTDIQQAQAGLRSAADDIDKLDSSTVPNEVAQAGKDYSGALRQLASDFDGGTAGIDAMNGHIDNLVEAMRRFNTLCPQ